MLKLILVPFFLAFIAKLIYDTIEILDVYKVVEFND